MDLNFIFQAQGDILKAVGELTKYLKVFQSDQEAWQELCDLYIQEQDYNKVILVRTYHLVCNIEVFHDSLWKLTFLKGNFN